jgi:7-keto-8-aminopelargonate synthetase-like enzyme
MDHAMVFSTGYQANLGIISTIAGKGDYIVLDIDSHASIWDGCKMGDAEVVPFKHNDIDAMEKRLKRIPEGAGKLVVLEGVYSMLGDIAPLKEMIAVAKAHGAMVLVDEAHSMGFIGPNGRGVAEDQGVLDDVDFVIGTFSQVGRHGRRLLRLQPSEVRDHAAGLPPLCVHRLAAAERGGHRLHLDPQADARRQQARAPVGEFSKTLHKGLRDAGFQLGTEEPQIGDHRGDHARSGARRGDVGGAAARRALRQPRPPARNARKHDLLRCSLCAEHSAEQVQTIIGMFTRAGKATGIIGQEHTLSA